MERKRIFDAVKAMLGRGFKQSEVAALDAAIDSAVKPDPPSVPEAPTSPAKISKVGLKLIQDFEGLHKVRADGRIEAYPDPGSGMLPITIGWGTTKGLDGKPFPLGTIITRDQAVTLLERDMAKYAKEVLTALGSAADATSQAQFDALVSFHYNTGAIANATLTRKHKAGDFMGAAAEFARWNKAGGRVLAGLTRRRAAEAALYRSGS